MNTRLSTLAAGVSITGLLAWLAYSASGASTASSPAATVVLQERISGSEVPCAVPLAWRVARVDPAFGLSRDDATGIVEEAARLWEGVGTSRLFVHDPDDGFPVRLVYDERQQRLEERERRSGELASVRADIGVRRDELEARAERHRASIAEYTARLADLDRRVGEHNAAVQAWNQSGDQSEARLREIEAAGVRLRREREDLVAERPALDGEEVALRRSEQDLNRRIAAYEDLADDLDSTLPPEEVEAGIYREAVSRQGDEIVEVSREIRLYRFGNADELRLLAAHEMGHALGLGHTRDPAGVMSASARSDRPVSELAESDLALFRAVCPAVAADG